MHCLPVNSEPPCSYCCLLFGGKVEHFSFFIYYFKEEYMLTRKASRPLDEDNNPH